MEPEREAVTHLVVLLEDGEHVEAHHGPQQLLDTRRGALVVGSQSLEELLAETELADALFDGAHLARTHRLRPEGDDDGGMTSQHAAVRGFSQFAGERIWLGTLPCGCSQALCTPHLHFLGDDPDQEMGRPGDLPGVLVGARAEVVVAEDEELLAAVDHLEVGEGLERDRALGAGDAVTVAKAIELVHRGSLLVHAFVGTVVHANEVLYQIIHLLSIKGYSQQKMGVFIAQNANYQKNGLDQVDKISLKAKTMRLKAWFCVVDGRGVEPLTFTMSM